MRQFGRFGPLVGSLDESTSTARFMVFAAKTWEMLTYHQVPVKTYYPGDGWAEQDPMEIWHAVLQAIEVTVDNLRKLDINPEDIVTVGIVNQRETAIVWNNKTGLPLHNAILWMDTRGEDVMKELSSRVPKQVEWASHITGLPPSGYFSAPKLSWLIRHSPRVAQALKDGECKFGTVDSWLLWNLTGGPTGGLHLTDVTNASRTMLMNIETLKWEKGLCSMFQVPLDLLPMIRSSSELYGYIVGGSLHAVPLSGCLGDQQAALVGQNCLEFGQAECTFNEGAFLLYNTGKSIIRSKNGLVTTIAYKMGKDAPAVYALEGSVANAGTALGWLYSGLGLRSDEDLLYDDDEDFIGEPLSLPSSSCYMVEPSRGLMMSRGPASHSSGQGQDGTEVYFVPAFSGLLAPYWRRDAGSVMCGISWCTSCVDVLQGALRSCGLQVRALLLAVQADVGGRGPNTLVGGGALGAPALLQETADCTGIPVVRPHQAECWALGAAVVAGSAEGIQVWSSQPPPSPSDTFYPNTTHDEREMMYQKWQMAIERSFGWHTDITTNVLDMNRNKESPQSRIYSSIPAGIFVMSSCLLLMLARHYQP